MDQVLRRHIWIVSLVSLALVAFFLASGAGSLVSLVFVGGEEPGAADQPRMAASSKRERFTPRSADDICRTNVFNFQKRPCADEDIPVGPDDEVEEVRSGIPGLCQGDPALVATMASSDPAWSFAMIKAEGKTMPYRAGDQVPGLGKIERVGWRLVLVDAASGPSCLLDLYPIPGGGEQVAAATPSPNRPPPPPGARATGALSPNLQKAVEEGIEVVSATERNVDRGLVDQLIENSSELMSQARILPYERDGQVQGFKLYGIRRNSLLGKLGLRNGDIVNSIGGMEMTSPDKALQAYTKLRNASDLSIAITRRGRRQTLDFNIR